MTKKYLQAPQSPEHMELFELGYRVYRDENRKYFAKSPIGEQLYSGDYLATAWDACQNQHTPQEEVPLPFPNPFLPPPPTVVCLCGSTRFSEAYQQANLTETLAGNIVLTIGCDMKSDIDIFADKSDEELATIKHNLDQLHLRKIDMADEVLVLNVDGYIGDSTNREIEYAQSIGKTIRYLEPLS